MRFFGNHPILRESLGSLVVLSFVAATTLSLPRSAVAQSSTFASADTGADSDPAPTTADDTAPDSSMDRPAPSADYDLPADAATGPDAPGAADASAKPDNTAGADDRVL